MKKIALLLLILSLMNLSCGQEGKLGYKKLNLETFDFSKKLDDYYSKKKFLQVDTYEINFDSTDIATTYMTLGDSLSYYGDTYFNGISMMRDDRNQTMALQTVARFKNTRPLSEFIKFLNEKYGAPLVKKHDDQSHSTCRWVLEDRILILNSIYKTPLYQSTIDQTTDSGLSNNAKFYIVKKEYKDRIIGKLNHGEWMSLE